MKFIACITDEPLYHFNFAFGVCILEVEKAVDLRQTVREAHIVEVDFIETDFSDGLFGKFDIILPYKAAVWTGPIRFGVLIWLPVRFAAHAGLRMVFREIVVLEAGDSADYVITLGVEFFHCLAVKFLLG
jgi:hypothetical protein